MQKGYTGLGPEKKFRRGFRVGKWKKVKRGNGKRFKAEKMEVGKGLKREIEQGFKRERVQGGTASK